MIKVGIAGIGFMGWIHYLAYQRVRGVKLAAFCTRNQKKLAGDWRSIEGNFGPRGEQVDVSGMKTYRQLSDLLADPEIDLIDNCLPPHLHADVSIQALKAGKHVFVEKPMGLTAAECRKMVAVAKKADRQILVGHVLPFFPEYIQARKAVDGGKYGKLLGGHFKRVISDPLWLKDFYDPDRVGGPLIDLHVHDAHFIRMLFGMPTSLVSQGRMRGKTVEYCETLFQFADPKLVVSATSGVLRQQGRIFTHAYEIHLEKASLHFDFAAYRDSVELAPLKILTDKGRVLRPKLGDGDPIEGFVQEIKEVARSLRSGQPSPVLSGDLARDAVTLCHKQADSVTRGRPVKV